MNKNVIVIMIAALAVAIGVAVFVQSRLSPPKPEGAAISSVPMVEVLVAKGKISVGETVDAEDLRWQKWPEDGIYAGMLIRKADEPVPEKILGQIVRRTVNDGEPMTDFVLVPEAKEGKNFVAATLRPGMRAVSLPVKAETAAGGFVRPGDYVDVIWTYQVRLRRDEQEQARDMVNRYAAQTILSNVRVIAVDQDAKDEKREAKIGRTVTLEVDKKGVEILALSKEMGDLSLALRRLGDKEEGEAPLMTTDTQISDIMRAVAKSKGITTSRSLRVYNGAEGQSITILESHK